MDNADEYYYENIFTQMVLSLTEAAMLQLGKTVNPQTGKTERDLKQAQGTIELMRMLQAKTRNNLNYEEQRLLEQNIMTLQMNFVYEQQKDQSPATGQPDSEQTHRPAKPAPPVAKESPEDILAENFEDAADDADSGLGKRPGMEN